MRWGLGLLLVLCVALSACSSGLETRLSVEIEGGELRGVSGDGIDAWLGVPYAAAPVGDLRWAEPASVERWSGVREATTVGKACLQETSTLVPTPIPPGETSEDCLFLNVQRPADQSEDLPVMVWLHGGGFVQGAGSQAAARSAGLVRRGVVLVSPNYRLGRLGFFAHPALEADVANFGLLDQIAALEWVRDNITQFGGDPDNVTIFGESAGGASVNALMVAPRARGLFQRAISQSGLGREPSQDLDDALVAGEQMATELDVPVADSDALRALAGEVVMTTQLNLFEGDVPIIDGSVVPTRIQDAFAEGKQAPVPYLIGTTDVEFPDGVISGGLGLDPDQLRRTIAGPSYDSLVATYGGHAELARHFLSDVIFTEPARFLASSHATLAPTYLYRFSIASAQQRHDVGGATHAAEVPYVFDAVDDPSVPGSAALSDVISDYWVAFATTGDPAHDGAAAWPEAGDGALLELTNAGPVVLTEDPWSRRLDALLDLAP